MKKIIIAAAIVVALLLAYLFIWKPMHSGMPQGMGMGMAMPVDVATVPVEDIKDAKIFSGRLSAVASAEIRPQIAGTIEAIYFKEGQAVKAGDKLFSLDARPYKATAAAAAAAAQQAQAAFARGQALRAAEAISQQQLEVYQEAAKSAAANFALANVNVERSVVKSPIDGRVGRADVTVGNVVAPETPTPLTTVESTSPIYADFDLSEQDYLNMLAQNGGKSPDLANMGVRLALANEATFAREGKLSALDNQVDAQSGAIRARATFDNADGALLPGLFAKVRMESAVAVSRTLINPQSISTNQDKQQVIVVGADGSPSATTVVTGDMVNGLREVLSGLNGGEKIVVNGLVRVRPGAKLMPNEVDMRTLQPLHPAAQPAAQGQQSAADEDETAEDDSGTGN